MMKKLLLTAVMTAGLLAWPPAGSANVMFDFETGNQGWGSFGPLTTDSGLLPTDGVGGSQGRFHTADFDLAGWGIVDVSPVVDMSPYTAMSVDARFRNVPGFTPFSGTPEMEFMLAIGYAEWATTVTLTDTYETYDVDFVDLVPQGAATDPITPAQLSDPGLQIKMVMRSAIGSGIGELDYDNVLGIPEPASAALIALGGFALLRRRR